MPKCGSNGTAGRRSRCITRQPPPLFEDGETPVAELECPQGSECPGISNDGICWVCTEPFDPLDPDGLGLEFPYIDEIEYDEDGTPKHIGPYRGIRTRKPKPSNVPESRLKRTILDFLRRVKTTAVNKLDVFYDSASSSINDPYRWSLIKGVGTFVFGVAVFIFFSKFIKAETIRRAIEKSEAAMDKE